MGLYDAEFCRGLVYGGGWSAGIIDSLKDAQQEIQKNFEEMDLENASVKEDMREIVDEMISELNQLMDEIESTHFS